MEALSLNRATNRNLKKYKNNYMIIKKIELKI